MKRTALINRAALVVTPKSALYEWVKSIDAKLDVEPPEGSFGDASIYLIPNWESVHSPIRYAEDNAVILLESVFAQWIPDPDLWPQERSWELAQNLLDIRVVDMVFDTVDDVFEERPLIGLDPDLDFTHDFRTPDGVLDYEAMAAWTKEVVEIYFSSPEFHAWSQQHPETPPGIGSVFSHFLHGSVGLTFTDVQPEHVEQFLFDFVPRKVTIGSNYIPAMIADLHAFFAFLGRQFEIPKPAVLQFLEKRRLAQRVIITVEARIRLDEENNTLLNERGKESKPALKLLKTGRNDPCPCGSGKKYKKCCG